MSHVPFFWGLKMSQMSQGHRIYRAVGHRNEVKMTSTVEENKFFFCCILLFQNARKKFFQALHHCYHTRVSTIGIDYLQHSSSFFHIFEFGKLLYMHKNSV